MSDLEEALNGAAPGRLRHRDGAGDARFQVLAARVRDGVAWVDPGGLILFANSPFLQMVGRSAQELIGTAFDDLALTYDRGVTGDNGPDPAGDAELVTVIRNDRTLAAVRCVTIHDVDRPGDRLVIFRSLDESWEQGDETLRQYVRSLRTLSECGRVLVRAETEQELLDGICQAMVKVGGYRLCWVGFMQPDGWIEPAAHTGFREEFLGGHGVSWEADRPEGHGVVGTCIRSRRPSIIRQALDHESYKPWMDLARKYGFRSVLGLPLIVEDSPIGALAFYAAEPDAFSDTEVELLQEVADDLAFGIYTRRLHSGSIQAQRDLRHAFAEISSQKDALDQHAIVTITDTQGRLTYVNAKFREISGYNDAEVLGRDARSLVDETLSPVTFDDVVQRLQKSGVWHGELCRIAKDGSRYWQESTVVPFRDGEGKVYQYVGLSTDITELKAAEEELQEMNRSLESRIARRTKDLERARRELESDIRRRVKVEEDLRRTNKELTAANRRLEETQNQLVQSEKMASIGQLAAGVAHEINNPIGYVYSNLGTLQEYVGDLLALLDRYERLERALGVETPGLDAIRRLKEEIDLDYIRADLGALVSESREGATRVKSIVQDLKDFSRTGSVDWEDADLNAGLESTLNIVHNELKYKAEIVKEYGELPPVRCVPSQLNQVFMNLLVNAAQAIEDRGTISVRSGTDEEGVWVEVADTGPGIPESDRKRIFDAFFTTKPVGRGTGLGLSLSYNIVAKHGGRIEVDSEPGSGTTFRVRLAVRCDSQHNDREPARPGGVER